MSSMESIPLSVLLNIVVQRAYQDLSSLVDTLSSLSDGSRKQALMKYIHETRSKFVRLLVILRWLPHASDVQEARARAVGLVALASSFTQTADAMRFLSPMGAALNICPIPNAVDVLTTGTYPRLPHIIKQRLIPPRAVSASEARGSVAFLEHQLRARLASAHLPDNLTSIKIERGRVWLRNAHLFTVSLTLTPDPVAQSLPQSAQSMSQSVAQPTWRLCSVHIEVEDVTLAGGRVVCAEHVYALHTILSSHLARRDIKAPLLHMCRIAQSFAVGLQAEVLRGQAHRGIRGGTLPGCTLARPSSQGAGAGIQGAGSRGAGGNSVRTGAAPPATVVFALEYWGSQQQQPPAPASGAMSHPLGTAPCRVSVLLEDGEPSGVDVGTPTLSTRLSVVCTPPLVHPGSGAPVFCTLPPARLDMHAVIAIAQYHHACACLHALNNAIVGASPSLPLFRAARTRLDTGQSYRDTPHVRVTVAAPSASLSDLTIRVVVERSRGRYALHACTPGNASSARALDALSLSLSQGLPLLHSLLLEEYCAIIAQHAALLGLRAVPSLPLADAPDTRTPHTPDVRTPRTPDVRASRTPDARALDALPACVPGTGPMPASSDGVRACMQVVLQVEEHASFYLVLTVCADVSFRYHLVMTSQAAAHACMLRSVLSVRALVPPVLGKRVHAGTGTMGSASGTMEEDRCALEAVVDMARAQIPSIIVAHALEEYGFQFTVGVGRDTLLACMHAFPALRAASLDSRGIHASVVRACMHNHHGRPRVVVALSPEFHSLVHISNTPDHVTFNPIAAEVTFDYADFATCVREYVREWSSSVVLYSLAAQSTALGQHTEEGLFLTHAHYSLTALTLTYNTYSLTITWDEALAKYSIACMHASPHAAIAQYLEEDLTRTHSLRQLLHTLRVTLTPLHVFQQCLEAFNNGDTGASGGGAPGSGVLMSLQALSPARGRIRHRTFAIDYAITGENRLVVKDASVAKSSSDESLKNTHTIPLFDTFLDHASRTSTHTLFSKNVGGGGEIDVYLLSYMCVPVDGVSRIATFLNAAHAYNCVMRACVPEKMDVQERTDTEPSLTITLNNAIQLRVVFREYATVSLSLIQGESECPRISDIVPRFFEARVMTSRFRKSAAASLLTLLGMDVKLLPAFLKLMELDLSSGDDGFRVHLTIPPTLDDIPAKKDGASAVEVTPEGVFCVLHLPRVGKKVKSIDMAVKLLRQGSFSSLEGWPVKSSDETHREVWDVIRKWSSSQEGQTLKQFTYFPWIVEKILTSF